MAEKIFEQAKLARLEFHERAAAADLARQQVHFQVRAAKLDDRGRSRPSLAQQEAEAGEQLGKRERLDQIIIRARG